MSAPLVPREADFAAQLQERADIIGRYAAAAVDDAARVLSNTTFYLDNYYVDPLGIRGHGRGSQVIYHRIHESPSVERKMGLSQFLREAEPRARF